ncbi:catalase domain-containing protein [Ditylenchus destructor]|uniref:Catalase domain-containing protein n=1 Tax=Ditylenchus destructor TaxID=166010 RepID=A0AAD4QX63_9BILA|nr:catalase domain-containing protein [Ditylenchus destructor]
MAPQTEDRAENQLETYKQHQPVMFLFSDRGTPDGFRHMNGYGSHTFKLVNREGNAVYCKFHAKTDQGIKNLEAEEAARLSGADPDYAIRDLYNAIETGDFPQWNFFIQSILTYPPPKGLSGKVRAADTRGRFVLNRNPSNYFAEVEQAAFCPSHVIPGIEFSPDKMLQGRLFSYKDTQYHRLGTNYQQLPINCPFRARPFGNTQRDGQMALGDNQGGAPNYWPNSFNGAVVSTNSHVRESHFAITGDVDRHDAHGDANYDQPAMFWTKVLDDGGRKRLVENILSTLKMVKPHLQERVIAEFTKVHKDMGRMLQLGIEKYQNNRHHI